LRALDGPTLTRVYAELAAGGRRDGGPLALKTVRCAHGMLRKALNDAVRQGLIGRNVAQLADLPRPQERADPLSSPEEADERIQVWTREEVQAFIRHRRSAEHRLWPLWMVALGTGMRRGELLGLRWKDVDLDKAVVRVRQQLVSVDGVLRFETPKTQDTSRRTISVDASVVEALRAQRKAQAAELLSAGRDRQDHGLVFTAPDGSPLSPGAITQAWIRAVRAAKVRPIRLHDARHTFATLSLAAGTPLHVVSKRLGHSTLDMTHSTYSHWLPDTDEQAASAFSAYVWEAAGSL
jgi:integrase